MRVLHIIGATIAGGAERVAVDIARETAARGHEITVVALSGRVDEAGLSMRRQLSAAGIAFRCGPAGPVGLGALVFLARVLSEARPDVVHLHTPNSELALALVSLVAGNRSKVGRTIHNVVLTRTWLYRWAYRTNSARVSAACSAAVADANADWASPVTVIQNGVTFDWDIQTPEIRNQACVELQLDPRRRHFLAVGSMGGDSLIQAQKAHDVLIHAWKKFSEGRHDCELHLVGDGNLRPALENLAQGPSGIRWWGVSSQVSQWLLAADVFVMPSRYEGLPIAGLEALGTGLPCVFSRIPPLLELNPRAVMWVSPDDVAGLARALSATMKGNFSGSRDDAERIRRDFGAARMADDYLRYYERLLA